MSRESVLLWLSSLTLLCAGCSGGGNEKYTIMLIPKGLTHEFWQSIHRGADRAAADLTKQGVSVRVLFEGPARENEAGPQIDIVNQAVGRRVSGIVLAPQHRKNMVEAVERSVNQKIPVVIIDSGLENPDLYVQYVATDNYNGGRMAAKRLLETLAGKGKKAPRLVLFRYQTGSESTERREQGFLDVIEEAIQEQKAKGEQTITWASRGEVELGATKETALENATPLLNKLGVEIDGIFAPNESSASGVVEALRSLRLNGKVTLVGFDSSEPLLSALKAGDVDGLIVQDPYRMGYLGVWVLVQHLEGKKIATKDKYLSTGEQLITRENVDSPEIQQLFREELQKKRTIQTPEVQ